MNKEKSIIIDKKIRFESETISKKLDLHILTREYLERKLLMNRMSSYENYVEVYQGLIKLLCKYR